MRERVEALVGPPAKAMWVSTFHSACVRILRQEATTLGLRSSFSIYDSADSQRLMTMVARELDLDSKRFPPKVLISKISALKDELIDPETFARDVRGRVGRGERVRRRARAGLRPLPGAAAPGARARLRRPDHDDRPPAAGVPRGRRALPAPVPARAGRRVPGHQPRAVHAGARAGGHHDPVPRRRRGRGPRRDPARRADRRRRRGPVDLRVPRRDDPQHRRVRAGLPRRADHPARAELPLDPDHPLGRERGHLAQPRPQAQAAVDRLGRGPGDRRLRRRQRARGGAVRRGGDRPAGRLRRRAARGRRGLLPGERAVPRARGGADPRRAAVQGGRRDPVLRAARGQGRGRLPAGDRQPGRRRQPAPHPQRAQARARRPLRGDGRRRSPSASGSRSGRRWSGSRRSRGWAPGRSPGCARSPG